MATDRTPAEQEANADLDTYVAGVLDLAVADYASWLAADHLDEPPEVCERWIDTLWDNLRTRLGGEQRLRAILLLLESRAVVQADRLLAAVDGCE